MTFFTKLLGPGAPGRTRNLALAGVAAIVVIVVAFKLFQPAPKQAGPGAVPVSVQKITRQTVPVYRYGYGTVRAFNSVVLKTRVDGALDKVLFREGQAVNAGDVLAQIDPRPYQAALNQALARKAQNQAQLGRAKRDLVRFQELSVNQFASRQNLESQQAAVDQLEAAVKADEAAIESTRVQLSYTTIAAPISGRIGLRQVDAGNLLRAADQIGLATITQIQPISVTFSLPASELVAISKAGLSKPLQVLAYTSDDKEKLAEGELLTVDNAVDETTGTIKLKATFANADERLWPGQSVSAHILLGTQRDALTVPSRAIQRGQNGLFVYLVQKDNTVTMQPVETNETFGANVAVVSADITEGDLVVVSGQSRLLPGAKIRIAAADAADAGDAGDAKNGSER